uniref:Uncharacterized protein n=1 Tax=Timema genevievae TaxID=629358 RepID=A0A7R9PKB1_TIMGE|nr:unnamed protein product [Timema genevievae]
MIRPRRRSHGRKGEGWTSGIFGKDHAHESTVLEPSELFHTVRNEFTSVLGAKENSCSLLARVMGTVSQVCTLSLSTITLPPTVTHVAGTSFRSTATNDARTSFRSTATNDARTSFRSTATNVTGTHSPTFSLPTQYSCHGNWEDNQTSYLIASPISRTSVGARRFCFIYSKSVADSSFGRNKGKGAAMLQMSTVTDSCHRHIMPGITGVWAFNLTTAEDGEIEVRISLSHFNLEAILSVAVVVWPICLGSCATVASDLLSQNAAAFNAVRACIVPRGVRALYTVALCVLSQSAAAFNATPCDRGCLVQLLTVLSSGTTVSAR